MGANGFSRFCDFYKILNFENLGKNCPWRGGGRFALGFVSRPPSSSWTSIVPPDGHWGDKGLENLKEIERIQNAIFEDEIFFRVRIWTLHQFTSSFVLNTYVIPALFKENFLNTYINLLHNLYFRTFFFSNDNVLGTNNELNVYNYDMQFERWSNFFF